MIARSLAAEAELEERLLLPHLMRVREAARKDRKTRFTAPAPDTASCDTMVANRL